jgi:hypothetical protein
MEEIKSCLITQGDDKERLNWKIDKKEFPKVNCNNCKLKTSFHPFYIDAGITGCISKSCEKLEAVARRILEYRNYKFLRIDTTGRVPKIFFLCDKGIPHEYSLIYENLRRGHGCKTCDRENRNRKETVKIERELCDCREKKLGKWASPVAYICAHYNFQIIFPDKAKHWNYELNGDVTPDQVSPGAKQNYWFYCPRFDESYEQIIADRTSNNTDCVYCSGKKLCYGNSLLGMYPELCKEYDPDNELEASEISPGSQEYVGWLCFNTDPPHKYSMPPERRTGKYGGCPECSMPGYKQLKGGHEYFIQECNKIHENKYTYVGRYVNSYTKMDIYCPVVSKNDEIHGIFSQVPSAHKTGAECPKCSNEREDSKIIVELKDNLDAFDLKIYTDYIQEKTFDDLLDKGKLSLDIYILANVLNISRPTVFERDGMQHFKPIEYWGGNEGFISGLRRDYIKDLYCIKNGINLIRIPYNIRISKEYLQNIFDLCKKSQVYMSYSYFLDKCNRIVDMKDISITIVKTPLVFDQRYIQF